MISDAVAIAIFTSLPATIAAIATMIITIRNRGQVNKIEIATNSMKDALIRTTETEALARGIKQGTTEEKARQKDTGS